MIHTKKVVVFGSHSLHEVVWHWGFRECSDVSPWVSFLVEVIELRPRKKITLARENHNLSIGDRGYTSSFKMVGIFAAPFYFGVATCGNKSIPSIGLVYVPTISHGKKKHEIHGSAAKSTGPVPVRPMTNASWEWEEPNSFPKPNQLGGWIGSQLQDRITGSGFGETTPHSESSHIEKAHLEWKNSQKTRYSG